MQINTVCPFKLNLQRSGGAIITLRVDIWAPNPWRLAPQSPVFQAATSPRETQVVSGLAPGIYTAVVLARIEESLNGVYDFQLDLDGAAVANEQGNVNTTASKHDSLNLRSQFVLVIQ